MDGELRAWTNGYECVVARCEKEAHDIVAAMGLYEEEDVDGDGWQMIPNEKHPLDEDGKPEETTYGEIVAAMGKPQHLWSLEP